MPECAQKGCRSKVTKKGQACPKHRNQPAAGGPAPTTTEPLTDAGAGAATTRAATISRNGYYGGKANQPHVHVYASGAHLKLGRARYNLYQNGKRHPQVDMAYEALVEHALGGQLRPWVDAALVYFGA